MRLNEIITTHIALYQFVVYSSLSLQTNTYQAIAITDGIDSYAIYTYRCDLMQWGGGATVGFNAFGVTFENHPSSRSSTVHTDIACANLHGSRGVSYSNLVFYVGSSNNPNQRERTRCLEIYKDDMRFPTFSFVDALLNPCPCNLWQAVFDWRFRFFSSDIVDGELIFCYIPRFRRFIFRIFSLVNVQCCYNRR